MNLWHTFRWAGRAREPLNVVSLARSFHHLNGNGTNNLPRNDRAEMCADFKQAHNTPLTGFFNAKLFMFQKNFKTLCSIHLKSEAEKNLNECEKIKSLRSGIPITTESSGFNSLTEFSQLTNYLNVNNLVKKKFAKTPHQLFFTSKAASAGETLSGESQSLNFVRHASSCCGNNSGNKGGVLLNTEKIEFNYIRTYSGLAAQIEKDKKYIASITPSYEMKSCLHKTANTRYKLKASNDDSCSTNKSAVTTSRHSSDCKTIPSFYASHGPCGLCCKKWPDNICEAPHLLHPRPSPKPNDRCKSKCFSTSNTHRRNFIKNNKSFNRTNSKNIYSVAYYSCKSSNNSCGSGDNKKPCGPQPIRCPRKDTNKCVDRDKGRQCKAKARSTSCKKTKKPECPDLNKLKQNICKAVKADCANKKPICPPKKMSGKACERGGGGGEHASPECLAMDEKADDDPTYCMPGIQTEMTKEIEEFAKCRNKDYFLHHMYSYYDYIICLDDKRQPQPSKYESPNVKKVKIPCANDDKNEDSEKDNCEKTC